VVKPTRRPATYALYEINVRLHLTPGLGRYQLKRLSVPAVQAFLNAKIQAGQSVRNVQILRQILSAALSRAVREELLTRNVARLAELPTWEPGLRWEDIDLGTETVHIRQQIQRIQGQLHIGPD
jgi:hypothetical protein